MISATESVRKRDVQGWLYEGVWTANGKRKVKKIRHRKERYAGKKAWYVSDVA